MVALEGSITVPTIAPVADVCAAAKGMERSAAQTTPSFLVVINGLFPQPAFLTVYNWSVPVQRTSKFEGPRRAEWLRSGLFGTCFRRSFLGFGWRGVLWSVGVRFVIEVCRWGRLLVRVSFRRKWLRRLRVV